jgi:hypothetical protein
VKEDLLTGFEGLHHGYQPNQERLRAAAPNRRGSLGRPPRGPSVVILVQLYSGA